MKRPYFPLYRYPYKNCYIMVYTHREPPRAAILVEKNKELFERMGSFFLGMGLEEISSHEAETWRKAYNKAKKWADTHQEEIISRGGDINETGS